MFFVRTHGNASANCGQCGPSDRRRCMYKGDSFIIIFEMDIKYLPHPLIKQKRVAQLIIEKTARKPKQNIPHADYSQDMKPAQTTL